MKGIGILTSGGDAPGMNAAVYGACVKAYENGLTCFGFKDGYEGLVDHVYDQLNVSEVKKYVNQGGTFLGTSRSERFKSTDVQDSVAEYLIEHSMALIVIGGDGSFKGVEALQKRGVQVLGIPATIDNDIKGTELTLGFQTAVRNVVDAVDIIMQSANSHRHLYAIEVMGRGQGYIAKLAGQALMADGIIAQTSDFDVDRVLKQISTSRERGHRAQLFIVAEGAMTAQEFKEEIENRSTYRIHDIVLGHLQRGGNPVAQDRIAGYQVGYQAVENILNKGSYSKIFLPINHLTIK